MPSKKKKTPVSQPARLRDPSKKITGTFAKTVETA